MLITTHVQVASSCRRGRRLDSRPSVAQLLGEAGDMLRHEFQRRFYRLLRQESHSEIRTVDNNPLTAQAYPCPELPEGINTLHEAMTSLGAKADSLPAGLLSLYGGSQGRAWRCRNCSLQMPRASDGKSVISLGILFYFYHNITIRSQ